MAVKTNSITMKPFKPTPKKVISLTIGRDYSQQRLRPPLFEDATNNEVSFGRMGAILDVLATPPIPEPIVHQEQPVKQSFWDTIKSFRISELVTVQ